MKKEILMIGILVFFALTGTHSQIQGNEQSETEGVQYG
jgi:hypothetical protein